MSAEALALGLREAVLALDFGRTPDALEGGAPLRQFPSLDLAVLAFPADGSPAFGVNLLFSRELPEGLIAPMPPAFGAQQAIGYQADLQGPDGLSVAWQPMADWSQLPFLPLHGRGPRFVAPYPASLLKLMVAVGVCYWLDLGHGRLDEAHDFEGRGQSLQHWLFDMLAVSSNSATSALIAWGHARGLLHAENRSQHALHRLFSQLHLPTLRLANTQPDGGWGNAAGAGVGQLQMSAWDSLRLLWWLDAQDPVDPAPPCPWLDQHAPRLQPASWAALMQGLREQGLDVVLSSSSLAGVPGFQSGIPSGLHPRWLQADGSAKVGEYPFPAASWPAAEVRFAHKIGNTENYSADAGIVRGLAGRQRHYLVALTSNLGSRYAPDEVCASSWKLPRLGAAIDALMQRLLGP